MGAVMYREEAIVVKKGALFSLVETGGMMHKALTASDGYYLFSEVGAGTKALVLVGAWHEIAYFLTSERKGIKNKRLGKENQDIYASAGAYTPRQLKGLFPGHAFLQSLAEAAVAFGGAQVPSAGSGISEFLERAGNVADFVGAREKMSGVEYYTKQRSAKKESPSVMYVRFNGFVETGAEKLGSGEIKFKHHISTILKMMEPHVT